MKKTKVTIATATMILGLSASPILAKDNDPAEVEPKPVVENTDMKQAERERLEANVSETSANEAQAKTEMQAAQAADQQAHAEAQSAQQELNNAQAEAAETYNNAESGISDISGPEQEKLDNAEGTIRNAQEDREASEKKIEDLTAKSDSLEKEKTEAEQEVSQAQENTGGLTEEDLNNAQAALDDAQKSLGEAQEDLENKQMILENNQTALEAAQKAQAEAQTKLEELTAQRDSLAETLKKASEKKEQAQAVYDELMSGEEGEAFKRAEKDLENAKAELDSAIEAQNAAQAGLDQKVQELKDAEAALGEAQKALDQAIAARTVDDAYLKGLQTKVDDLNKQKEAAQKKASEMAGKIRSLQEQTSNAEAQLAQARTNVDKITEEYNNAMSRYYELMGDVETARGDYETAKQNLETTIKGNAVIRADLAKAKEMLAKPEVQNDPILFKKYSKIKAEAEECLEMGMWSEEHVPYAQRELQKYKGAYEAAVKKAEDYFNSNANIQAYNNIETSIAQAEAKIEKLLADMEIAEVQKDFAESEHARISELYNAYKDILKEAKSGVSRLELDVMEAQAAVDDQKNSLWNLTTAKETLQEKVDAAAQAAQQARELADLRKEDRDAVKEQMDSFDKEVSDAQKIVDNHKDPHTNKEYAKGFLGFLEWMKGRGYNVDEAIKLLKTSKEIGYSDMGKAGDGTDLDMVRKALEWIDYGNHIRTDEEGGLEALKVSPYLMAMAESNLGYSIYNHGHSKQYERCENLAYGYGTSGRGPFYGWYDEEKVNYETQNGGQTGHYFNLVSATDTVTGFACTGGWTRSVFVQTFHDDYVARKGDNFTVEEMMDLLDQYINEIVPEEKAFREASGFLSFADQARSDAKIGYIVSEDAYNADNTRAEAKAAHLQSLQDAFDAFDQASAEAENALANAAAALDTARDIFNNDHVVPDLTKARDAAAETVQKAKTARDDAGRRLEEAKNTVEDKKANVADKQQVIDTYHAGLQAAKDNLDKAVTALEKAQSAYDDAVQKAADQKDTVAAATETVAQAQKAVDTAGSDAKKAEEVVSARTSVEDAAQARVQEIRTKLAELLAARSHLEDVLSRIQDTHAAIEAAGKGIENDKKSIAEAEIQAAASRARLEKCSQAQNYLDSLTKDSVIEEGLTFGDDDLDALIPEMQKYIEALKKLASARENFALAQAKADQAHNSYKEAKDRYDQAAQKAGKAKKALDAYINALKQAERAQTARRLAAGTTAYGTTRVGERIAKADPEKEDADRAESEKRKDRTDSHSSVSVPETDGDQEVQQLEKASDIDWGVYTAEIAAGLAVIGGVIVIANKRHKENA